MARSLITSRAITGQSRWRHFTSIAHGEEDTVTVAAVISMPNYVGRDIFEDTVDKLGHAMRDFKGKIESVLMAKMQLDGTDEVDYVVKNMESSGEFKELLEGDAVLGVKYFGLLLLDLYFKEVREEIVPQSGGLRGVSPVPPTAKNASEGGADGEESSDGELSEGEC